MLPATYYIDTMGCQMNERDSETIAGILQGLGYRPAGRLEEARVVVLNTCAVREKPEHKVFSKLGSIGRLKRRHPEMIVVVAGCVAQVLAEGIQKHTPFVDIVVGPRNLSALAEAVAQAGQAPWRLTDDAEVVPEGLAFSRAPGVGAFVNVSYGCNNFCSYCIVPYARGREQSRDPRAVVEEVRRAVDEGYREITLLGQNVNSYRGGETDFPELLRRVDAVEGLERFRFTTSHPKDLSPRLLDAMAQLPTVCEHLYLPIQAGDDEVLHRMGRGYTYEHFLGLVEAARAHMPGLSLTTDVMVGFPGETEKQFLGTLRAFEEIRFDQAFMFKYSDRPGTKASEFPDKVSEQDKQDRHVRLVEVQNRIAREVNQALVGGVFEVLVEGRDPKSPEKLRGRTRSNKLVIFPGSSSPGSLLPVRTEEAYLWGFLGRAEG